MSGRSPLLLEIGCEEIPARMIPGAARDLTERLTRILDSAGIEHGEARAFGGSRRLAVRVEEVRGRQEDRKDQVLGPPSRVAFSDSGEPTPAALGFAAKQNIDPGRLETVETPKGSYVGFVREVAGKSVGQVLAESLPAAVESMSFPKIMRWGDGTRRWVRPVHWVLALHGEEVLPLELFGVRAGGSSAGHRFLGAARVKIEHPDVYAETLRTEHVVVEPAQRRGRLGDALDSAASEAGGTLVEDSGLLEEVADLVEWPAVVTGGFDAAFLDLPRELLVTTLRHHQKCFSIRDAEGRLLPRFLAVANTDRDPAGHIRRGNEWVIGGRLDDARFFWHEDRKRPLAERSKDLEKVVFHAELGSYADKAVRTSGIAGNLARQLGLDAGHVERCVRAALLAKNDLVTGTVGEFPELQGQVGGLLLELEGEPPEIARAVYEHYRPTGPDDAVAGTDAGGIAAVADRLDSLGQLIGIGKRPAGRKDPFGLRRAASGVFRTVLERDWGLSLNDLAALTPDADGGVSAFLLERFQNYLRDSGCTANEVQAVFRPKVASAEALGWPLPDVLARIEAIGTVRQRADFAHLVDLTKRVDNILSKRTAEFASVEKQMGAGSGFREHAPAAVALRERVDRQAVEVAGLEREQRYTDVVDALAEFVAPVERFFDDVLVLDPDDPPATVNRRQLLESLRGVLTRCFDIRELAGQADRRD